MSSCRGGFHDLPFDLVAPSDHNFTALGEFFLSLFPAHVFIILIARAIHNQRRRLNELPLQKNVCTALEHMGKTDQSLIRCIIVMEKLLGVTTFCSQTYARALQIHLLHNGHN